MKSIYVTGQPQNNRDIIDMCRDSKTPASMDRRILDVTDDSVNHKQCSLASTDGSIWLDPGMWVIETSTGVFNVFTPS